MSKHFSDYKWKNGFPYGVQAVPPAFPLSYKIVSDPYRKRISVERWKESQFIEVCYDSALLDFRRLQPVEQKAWQKMILHEDIDTMTAEIRDQDDRTLLIEVYRFEEGLCRGCLARSPHGPLLSQQQIFYRRFGDSFDGVLLCDSTGRPVMFKRYLYDENAREFSELLQEEWDMIRSPPPFKYA